MAALIGRAGDQRERDGLSVPVSGEALRGLVQHLALDVCSIIFIEIVEADRQEDRPKACENHNECQQESASHGWLQIEHSKFTPTQDHGRGQGVLFST